jgi:hypothetical protein
MNPTEGALWVVNMASRNHVGERLRSNRLELDTETKDSVPPSGPPYEDKVINWIDFDENLRMYLFSIGLGFVGELDSRQVSEELRHEFEVHGEDLTSEVRVTRESWGYEWYLLAGRKYLIKRENEQLKVYLQDLDYYHPGGVQMVGDLLAVSIDKPNEYPPECDVDPKVENPPEYCPAKGMIAFFDASPPYTFNPKYLGDFGLVNQKYGVGAVGITRLPEDGHYFAVVFWDDHNLQFYRSNLPNFTEDGFEFTLHDTIYKDDPNPFMPDLTSLAEDGPSTTERCGTRLNSIGHHLLR